MSTMYIWFNGNIPSHFHSSTTNNLRTKNTKKQLFAPFGSLGYPPSPSRGHSPLPGVDGSAATSGLTEFLFCNFLVQKWDVVVVGVAFPSCYFHGPIVISRHVSESEC